MIIRVISEKGELVPVEVAKVIIPGFEWLDACAHQVILDGDYLETWAISDPETGARFNPYIGKRWHGGKTIDEEIAAVKVLLEFNHVTPQLIEAVKEQTRRDLQESIENARRHKGRD
jgi:hypothetical protein